MAIDIQLKTIIELIFFALLLILAIYVFMLLYNTLFPTDNSLEILHERVEFVICGGYMVTSEQRTCPSNHPARNMFFLEAQGNRDRLLFFDDEGATIPYDYQNRLNMFWAWVGDTFSSKEYVSPCSGPCICRARTDDDAVSANQCRELSFTGSEVTFYRKNSSKLFESTNPLVLDDYEPGSAIIYPEEVSRGNFYFGVDLYYEDSILYIAQIFSEKS